MHLLAGGSGQKDQSGSQLTPFLSSFPPSGTTALSSSRGVMGTLPSPGESYLCEWGLPRSQYELLEAKKRVTGTVNSKQRMR